MNNSFEKLKTELRILKYPQVMSLTLASFAEGLPPVFLPLIHYSLLEYSAPVAHFINKSGFDLLAKNDLRFIESVYKLLLTSF